MKRPTVVGLLALTSACSVLYDPNNLGVEQADAPIVDADLTDASPDAPPDAAIDAPPDAPPDAPGVFTLGTISAPTLHEGLGVGSRPALVIVNVSGLTTQAPIITLGMITDGAMMRQPTVIASDVAANFSKIAIAIEIPVLTSVGDGATRTMHLTIEQAGAMIETDLTVVGLDELAPTAATFDTLNLKPLYSRAVFNSAVRFIGAGPALIRTTSNILVSEIVNVDGAGQGAGAHGCSGGAGGTVGGCGASGGGGGTSGLDGSAGGGGGFGAAGIAGMGNAPGAGGEMSGDDFLISLTTQSGSAGNRGNGGGGGGVATLGAGGAGGGGGGVLELTAGGSIMVDADGRLRANGSNGAAGGGVGGGNGGGGSGGAIVVRSGAGILTAPAGWVIANGGIGAGTSMKGGNGSVGRVRIDSTTPITGMVTGPIPRQGAAWATDAPMIFSTLPQTVKLVGALGLTYGVVINDVPQMGGVFIPGGGFATLSPTWVVGRNTLCALTTTAATIADTSAMSCIDVVYLP